VTEACDACLRHSALIGFLSPRIAGALDRPGRRLAGVLALGEEELIDALAGTQREAAHAFRESFDCDVARRSVAASGATALCSHSETYPGCLLELQDPPLVIYFTGGAERLVRFLDEPVVTLVGARRGTSHGQSVCHELARGLGAAGVTVASGLALGIDAQAHRGALDAGGNTIAVLACGTDVVYPRRHRRLWERVREHGILMSELPPGTVPLRWSFPARNRIMAALSTMTIVVEAAESSGSLITAEFAADLGRAVAAVPGRVNTRVAAGSNRLLRDGAPPVLSAADVLDDIFGVGASARTAAAREPDSSLEPELRRVLDGVEAGDGIEDIGRATRLEPGAVRAALGRLEAMGYVRRDPFGIYERSAG
jgi:DNA processing protein